MSAPVVRGMLEAAIAQADARRDREGRCMTVYHTARDRYGRDAVFYVRADDEGGAPWDEGRNAPATTAYVAQAPEGGRDAADD